MPEENRLIATEDGSLSRLDEGTGELFHNKAGAITEALKNYVEPSGAIELIRNQGSLAMLDVCFGLGYNTWMLIESVLTCDVSPAGIKVFGVERDADVLPDAITVLKEEARLGRARDLFRAAVPEVQLILEFGRKQVWNRGNNSCELTICQGDLREVVPRLQGPFDLIFHDPFSPARVPELWTVDIFKHYHRLLRSNGGKLLTYSSATAVRGGLREAGFTLWRTAAVGGKRGGTLACTDTAPPTHAETFALSEDEERRLRTRSKVPYRDPSLSSSRADILARRNEEQAAC